MQLSRRAGPDLGALKDNYLPAVLSSLNRPGFLGGSRP